MKYKGGLLPPVHERRRKCSENMTKENLLRQNTLLNRSMTFILVCRMSGKLKRLETLMKKLDALIEEEESDE